MAPTSFLGKAYAHELRRIGPKLLGSTARDSGFTNDPHYGMLSAKSLCLDVGPRMPFIMDDSQQLVELACSGINPERVPIFDIFCNDAVVEHFAGDQPDPDDRDTMISAAAAGLDATRRVSPPSIECTRFADVSGNERENLRWTTWVKSYALRDADEWAAWLGDHIDQIEAEEEPDPEQIEQEK